MSPDGSLLYVTIQTTSSAKCNLFYAPLSNWATGHIGWGGVVGSVFLDSLNEADIIMVGGLAAILIRLIKIHPENVRSTQRVLSRLNGNFLK